MPTQNTNRESQNYFGASALIKDEVLNIYRNSLKINKRSRFSEPISTVKRFREPILSVEILKFLTIFRGVAHRNRLMFI